MPSKSLQALAAGLDQIFCHSSSLLFSSFANLLVYIIASHYHQDLTHSLYSTPAKRPDIMAPGPITIDLSDDISPAPVSKGSKRTLLLAPPSVAADEAKIRDVFATYDRSFSDLQMLDRLSAGFVSLPAATYDLVLVLTDADGARRREALSLLTRDLYTTLAPSMRPGAKLQLQDGPLAASEAREAILAGLVEKDGAFEKIEEEEVVVPLRFGAKKKINSAQNGNSPVPPAASVQINLDDDLNSDDELINEDDLMTEEDLKRPIQIR
jgi:anamorsin